MISIRLVNSFSCYLVICYLSNNHFSVAFVGPHHHQHTKRSSATTVVKASIGYNNYNNNNSNNNNNNYNDGGFVLDEAFYNMQWGITMNDDRSSTTEDFYATEWEKFIQEQGMNTKASYYDTTNPKTNDAWDLFLQKERDYYESIVTNRGTSEITKKDAILSLKNIQAAIQKARQVFNEHREMEALKYIDPLEINQRNSDKVRRTVGQNQQQQPNRQQNQQQNQVLQQQQMIVQYSDTTTNQDIQRQSSSSNKQQHSMSFLENVIIQTASIVGKQTGKFLGGTKPENWVE